MDSFEELGVGPGLVEALAAEGIERPTPLQESAVPMLRRGNNLVLTAGPGSGTFAAWAVPLLERIDAEGQRPLILALTPTAAAADRLAESMGRMAAVTGHAVAAVGSPWISPERAHVLFGTPEDVLALAGAGTLSLTEVEAVVVDQANLVERLSGLESVEQILDYLPKEAQRIVSALPLTDAVSDFVERHVLRAMMIPGRAADPDAASSSPHRGTVRFRVAVSTPESATLATAAELLEEGARHVLVYCRSDDRAADVGDYLTLRGYAAGAPGDDAVPVWLGVDALATRSAIEGMEPPVVVSCDVPSDPDVLDRRHGISEDGVVIVLPRELPHLRDVARRTGYKLQPLPAPPASAAGGEVARLRATLLEALEEEDIAPYLLALEPLFEAHDPAEVAAAAVALLRKKGGAAPAPAAGPADAGVAASGTPSWTKLFLSVGERDGAGPGDLLGAITGEAGVEGNQVGRIDISESHTVVEVHSGVAQRVIKALNGTTLKGRAMRVDYDRPHRGGSRRGGGGRSPRR